MILLLRGPEDDPVKGETCRLDYIYIILYTFYCI